MRLAETLATFLTRLRSSAGALEVLERQRVLRLLVKEILVGDDRIIIRHCIALPMAPADGPPAGRADAPLPATQSYLLRSRSRDAALGRAARVALATTDAPGPVAIILFLDRRLQPQLDQPEHVPVHDATSY